MNKKCIGCGVVLQNTQEKELGYTNNLNNTYCKRCFKLKHYGELIRCDTIDDEELIKNINKNKGLVFYLVDFLNINKETIGIFKCITIPKVLVISKCDTLRREMKYEKIIKWLENVYKIDEDVLFISSKKSNISNNIFKYMAKYNYKKAFITGITNAGKSTFINKLLKENGIKKEILASNKPNTTLDFIKLNIGDYLIVDTPGFSYTNWGNEIIEKEIKPLTFKVKENTTLVINNKWKCKFLENNSVTLYLTNELVSREYQNNNNLKFQIKVANNSDVIIPGIGFLNIKKECFILTNFEEFEVRSNISEVSYE